MTLLRAVGLQIRRAADCGTDCLAPFRGRWRELAVAREPKIAVKVGRSESWVSI